MGSLAEDRIIISDNGWLRCVERDLWAFVFTRSREVVTMAKAEEVVDPDLVHLGRITRWMDSRGLGSGPLEDVHLLGGGTQNILVGFTRSGFRYVLRRPPRHKRPNSDDTMLREAMVLEALENSDVPHPRFVACCGDTDVIGSAFYLMEAVENSCNLATHVPTWHPPDPLTQRRLGWLMVDGLLALSRVEPAQLGLSELGRPNGWLERQVPRWRRQLHAYPREGLEETLAEATLVETWLVKNQPRKGRLGLVHGDFHIANLLFGEKVPALEAIVDWELTTQGDPLLDLGHLLATWPYQGNAAGVVLTNPLPALPGLEEVITHYARRSGRDIEDIRWFHVLACYRLAVILAGTYIRSRAGQEPQDIGRNAHRRAFALLTQARELIRS